ncbi:DUF1622 domain-containing protein [Candidatus Peribacteria bacterium]|nr:MAG: DUF1622 domain-containing protein [Candidatus Peribacteria bacterium]
MFTFLEELIQVGTLSTISRLLGEAVGYIGIMIIMYGALMGVWMFAVQIIKKDRTVSGIRIELGQYLTLGLEFLIGKDIIESLVNPSWDDLGKLGAIIVLRSILTLFLERELMLIKKEELPHATPRRSRSSSRSAN